MSTLDRVHGGLKFSQQSLATVIVAECLTKFQGSVSKLRGNTREARDTWAPPLEHLQQFQSQLKEFELVYPPVPDIVAESSTFLHVQSAQNREALSAGTANIFGRLSFRHAGQRHWRLDDEVHFVRECGGRSEGRFAEERSGVDAAHHNAHNVDGGSW